MLKSLELFGFKSFADRTRFDFAAGVTCVVGPNGSGKSNVVDALKWILGDQSAKSLRGKEMTDVIFNGSKSRKPNGFAEALLTFDNSQGWLPVEAAEVQIGRRLWRNGDSEYLLNRSAVRLKDIKDLFLGTGAGSAAYSIIEQGRVDQILQANPTSRRAVFEEAAGISRFKARKADAQRKLERVAQNLLRLTDIVDEVEARLNATRSQAAKAAKFREVSETLKAWWLGLAADDYRAIQEEMAKIDGRLQELDQQIADLVQQLRDREAHLTASDAEAAELEDQVREVDRRNATAREAIAGFLSTIQHQGLRLQELEAESLRLGRQQLALQKRVQASQIGLTSHTEQLNELESEHAQRLSRMVEHESRREASVNRLVNLRQRSEGARTRRLELTKTVSASTQALASWQERLESLEAAVQDFDRQLERSTPALQEAQEGSDMRRRVVLQATETLSHAQSVLRTIQGKRQELRVSQGATQAALADARERRSAAIARKSLLEDLETRQEGIGIGPREILQRAKKAKTAPWNSIVGLVADLLEVDLENAALLEVALGSRGQLIVLRDYQPWLDYLLTGPGHLNSRIGFLAIPDLTHPTGVVSKSDGEISRAGLDPTLWPDLSDAPGVLQRADLLVTGCGCSTALPPAVLCDTWVVETLEHAVALATTRGRGCRFVTRQGEVLESDGSLHVGPVRAESAVLSRKSELKRLKQQLIALDQEIESRESSLAKILKSLAGSDQDLELAAQAVEEAQGLCSEARAELLACEQVLQRLVQGRAELAQKREGAAQDWQAATAEHQNLTAQALAAQAELQQTESLLVRLETELSEAEKSSTTIEREQTADQLDLAKQAERITAWKTQLDRLIDEKRQREMQAAEGRRRVEATRQKIQQIRLHILNTRAETDERRYAAEQVEAGARELLDRRAALRANRAQLAQAVSQCQNRRRTLTDERQQQEFRKRELQQTVTSLAERLDEEYQIQLGDVVSTNASALALHLRERAGQDGQGEATGMVVPTSDGETPTFAELRPELEAHVLRLKKKLKLMGSVNPDSLAELDALETRFQQQSAQLRDLVEAKNTLEDIIRRINGESRRMFLETFEVVRTNFQELFRTVFGGGEGDIILEDPNDVLECGLEIKARPPGKELRNLSLLSGGEKTMTAIALIMAIFQAKPSPFCILDEVDAALDEANVERFTNVIRKFQHSTQFIMITHHKRSMTVGDVLYGVTMEESGVSKRMAVRFEDVGEDGKFRSAA